MAFFQKLFQQVNDDKVSKIISFIMVSQKDKCLGWSAVGDD